MDLDLRGELYIGGVWVDATGDILQRQALVHTRGRQDQGARVDPSICRPLLNNTNGQFSPDNPMGPYYGQFGRNTPFRVSVRAGSHALVLDGSVDGIASTPDHASLDITGDLDLRWEGETDWYASGSRFLLGKWAESGNRVYALILQDGALWLRFVTAAGDGLFAFASLPMLPRHAAVRATLDADNGGGGFTVRLYWAPTMAGPWTQFGGDLSSTAFGAITMRVTTAPLSIAPSDLVTSTRYPAAGRIFRAEVRNGISGPIVAGPDFAAQAPGTTSFADVAGRTWTLSGTASITNRRTRLVHELAAYPTRWHPSGAHVWVEAQTAGILRRMRRSSQALDSTLRRRIPSYAPLAYWPLEEGTRATQGYSPIPGVAPLSFTAVDWGSADSLPSSNALPALNSSTGNNAKMTGVVPAAGPSLPAWSVNWLYRLDQPNDTHYTFMRILSTGTVREWYVQSRADQSRIIGKNAAGTEVFNQLIATSTDLYGQWVLVRFRVMQEGGNVRWRISWQDVGGDAGGFTDTFPGTSGRPTGVASPPDGYAQALNGMAIGHIGVFDVDYTRAYDGAIDAWTGETAGARMQRLAEEEALPLVLGGPTTEQEQVGPQLPAPVLSLLEDAADADGGILYEDRERPALRYRSRSSMYNQIPALTLDYTQPGLASPLEPTGDDDGTENDVTVTRAGGSSGRAVLEEGALSVQAPPDGVGPYPVQETLNLHDDAQTEPLAYWRLHLGTYEGRRYPQVRVMVHQTPPALLDQILAVDVGDRVVIRNPPPWLAPGDIELIVQGYEETWESEFQWDIVFNCSPGEPWLVAVADGPTPSRADTDATELAEPLDPDETAVDVRTTAGPAWESHSDLPVNISVGGEVMTVTGCGPAVRDTFGRTVASGWGTADSGQAWTVTGAAADYAVGSGYGSATNPTTGIAHLSLATAPSADVDLYMDVATDQLATGASLLGGPIARAIDNNNLYQARLEFTTAAGIALTVRKRVSGTETQLGIYTSPLTHTAGTFYRVRFQVIGSALRAKVWPATGSEPSAWHIEATDTAITAANKLGIRAFRNTGNTTANAQFRFDNLTLTNLQTLTVIRSVNGVIKPHAAGTAVAVDRPAVAAL